MNKFWESDTYPYFTIYPIEGVEPFLILNDLDAHVLQQEANEIAEIVTIAKLQADNLMHGYIYLAKSRQSLNLV